jgi:phosphate transport system permease protein
VGGGIYLNEYSQRGWFAQFVTFGNDVLAGVPSIISGVFVYGLVVATRIFFGQSYSAMAGGIALAVLMLPTVIKTTDEGLKLVPQELRWGAYGVGASKFVTVVRVTLPAAFTPIATGVVLAIARAAGETAPLIFTALFSPFWPEGVFNPIATMSVLIFNFAIMPYEAQNALAWAASFVLVVMILAANLTARWISNLARKT